MKWIFLLLFIDFGAQGQDAASEKELSLDIVQNLYFITPVFMSIHDHHKHTVINKSLKTKSRLRNVGFLAVDITRKVSVAFLRHL